jgi:hypothetical protein
VLFHKPHENFGTEQHSPPDADGGQGSGKLKTADGRAGDAESARRLRHAEQAILGRKIVSAPWGREPPRPERCLQALKLAHQDGDRVAPQDEEGGLKLAEGGRDGSRDYISAGLPFGGRGYVVFVLHALTSEKEAARAHHRGDSASYKHPHGFSQRPWNGRRPSRKAKWISRDYCLSQAARPRKSYLDREWRTSAIHSVTGKEKPDVC